MLTVRWCWLPRRLARTCGGHAAERVGRQRLEALRLTAAAAKPVGREVLFVHTDTTSTLRARLLVVGLKGLCLLKARRLRAVIGQFGEGLRLLVA